MAHNFMSIHVNLGGTQDISEISWSKRVKAVFAH